MKLTKLALAASLAIFANANAATINFSNLDFTFGGNDLILVDNAGNPLGSGFAALSTTPDTSGILADSLVAITGANSPAAGFFNSPLSSANDGSLNGVNLFVVFDVIYTERNLTRAAEVLCLTQPTVSNALSRLRKTFNDELFVRSPKGMASPPLTLISGSDSATTVICNDRAVNRNSITMANPRPRAISAQWRRGRSGFFSAVCAFRGSNALGAMVLSVGESATRLLPCN